MDIDEIRAALAAKGMKQRELAEQIGLDTVQMSKVMTGRRRFTVAEMDRVREVLRPASPAAEGLRLAPVIGMVPAGNWRQAVQQPRDWMPVLETGAPRNVFYLDVEGDSMDKVVPEGGRVLVNPDDRALYPGRMYVISNAEGETTFKMFMDGPARLVPLSTNPAHADIPIGEEPFSIVGRVIWSASPH